MTAEAVAPPRRLPALRMLPPVSGADRRVLAAALPVVALSVLWAAHDGGYDADTWYWGALVVLALATAAAITGGGRALLRADRAAQVAVALFAAYVALSYASILWADAPGAALQGSNRALMYLLVFALFAALPWNHGTALVVMLAFTLGIGALVVTELLRLATGHLVASSFDDGRLVAPTQYFNATPALFTTAGLMALLLACRAALPALLRGVLAAIATGGLQLAVLGQSRGWLFTLPLVLVATVALSRERLRLAVFAAPVVAGVLAAVPRLLDVFPAAGPRGQATVALLAAARRAGHTAVVASIAVLLAVGVIALLERVVRVRPSARARRGAGIALVAAVLAGGAGGAVAATHGDPFGFVSRQWRGFTHVPAAPSGGGSHFTAVGSGRYDFWRVAWHATVTHPIGGLGQDNFGDYYVSRRRTYEQPSWTHSLELRLLAHTGLLGFALFAGFVAVALGIAARAVRGREPATAAVAAVCVVPLADWLIHGSVDWFWEFPALSGPALAFLGIAVALGDRGRVAGAALPASARPRWAPRAAALAGAAAVLAATAALGFPYVSVREVSRALAQSPRNPSRALRDLSRAASLNPLNADPGRFAGSIALFRLGDYGTALQRFTQAAKREPHAWLPWLGAGLAASSLGRTAVAREDLARAAAINPREGLIQNALDRVGGPHPMTPAEALQALLGEG